MKSFQNLIYSGLIAAVLFWHAPGQTPVDGAAGTSNPVSAANPNSPVVQSPPTSVGPSPATPGTSNTQPVNFSMAMTFGVVMALLLSQFLQKSVIDSGVAKGGPPSSVLKHLIREVEESSGYTRNDARAKAKAWLVENVTSLGENEIFLAKTHFSYLLPPDWGAKAEA
jgi:hypothetical protein